MSSKKLSVLGYVSLFRYVSLFGFSPALNPFFKNKEKCLFSCPLFKKPQLIFFKILQSSNREIYARIKMVSVIPYHDLGCHYCEAIQYFNSNCLNKPYEKRVCWMNWKKYNLTISWKTRFLTSIQYYWEIFYIVRPAAGHLWIFHVIRRYSQSDCNTIFIKCDFLLRPSIDIHPDWALLVFFIALTS